MRPKQWILVRKREEKGPKPFYRDKSTDEQYDFIRRVWAESSKQATMIAKDEGVIKDLLVHAIEAGAHQFQKRKAKEIEHLEGLEILGMKKHGKVAAVTSEGKVIREKITTLAPPTASELPPWFGFRKTGKPSDPLADEAAEKLATEWGAVVVERKVDDAARIGTRLARAGYFREPGSRFPVRREK